MRETISALLLAWYDQNARTLPWRGIHDPYRTWVSETMLQQTRVETVRGYYERFLARFPDVAALAHQAARQVVRDFGGEMPREVAQLRQLKGIGAYTAGAIASIAFDQRVPAVDGNVIRVASRVMGIRENVGIPSLNLPYCAAICNWAKSSLRDICPLRAHCDAYDAGDAEDLPVLPQKNPPKPFDWDVLLIFSGEKVLMRQRTETMLHGLWVFPMLPGHTDNPADFGAQMHMNLRNVRPAGDAKHVFTHQIWRMKLYQMDAPDADAPKGYRYVTRDEMNALTIPTAMKAAGKVARARLEENSEFGMQNAE